MGFYAEFSNFLQKAASTDDSCCTEKMLFCHDGCRDVLYYECKRCGKVEWLTGMPSRAPTKKRDDGLFSFSLVAGRSKAVVDDQEKLPFDMVEIVEVIKPKAKEIKEALEAGKEVPGAHLEYGADYVMIRSSGNKGEE